MKPQLVPPAAIGAEKKLFMQPSITWPWEKKKRDFESALRPELPVLYRVAKRLARNDDDASDLVGQTMMLAHRAWHNFDGQHLRSWLIRILRNEYLKKIRSAKDVDSLEDAEFEAADESADVWSSVSQQLDLQSILDEIDRLSEEYKMAIVLCDVEQLSYEEAAAVMDVPIGTVRSRLFRARSILRTKLSHRILEGVDL